MSEHPIQNLMTETMERIKNMVDVNTIVGTPITTADGTTIIPVSKVSCGFGGGGTDFVAKDNAPLCFGGGGGAGVTVEPVCFLIVSPTTGAHILPVDAQAVTTADRIVEMLPNAFNKVTSFVDSRKAAKAAAAEAPAAE
ncbi:MAG: GerW family sporulation protein [Butyricicoccus sp.]|nr:GerW family sporulation protein [Butyricicoccus sp.]